MMMQLPATDKGIQTLEYAKTVEIAAPADVVFESILLQVGPENQLPDGTPMPMKIEAWPGGRWFRDLGDNKGHLWGFVQVIKPPLLLELNGPLFMSYPGVSHIQYRVVTDRNKSVLKFLHRAMGLIPPDHKEGVVEGWNHILKRIAEAAEKKA
jgi:hypothetical protein